jgi:hypothetical protein
MVDVHNSAASKPARHPERERRICSIDLLEKGQRKPADRTISSAAPGRSEPPEI